MRQLIICRGVQGSGKSTIARKMHDIFHGSKVICSADDYFIKDGVYTWSAELLYHAHKWCNNLINESMSHEIELIIVDNTSIKYSDMKTYLNLAISHNYRVSILSIDPFELPTLKLVKRNTHGARPELIDKLKKKWHTDKQLSIFINRSFGDVPVKLLTVGQEQLNDPIGILQSLLI